MKIYLNGETIDANEARIDPMDRGFLLGDGLFETFRVKAGKAQRIDSHLSRLARGCNIIKMPYPNEIEPAIAEIISVNKIVNGSVRLTLTRGLGPRGVLPPPNMQPTVMISATEIDMLSQEPIKAIIAESTRRNEFSPLSQCKCLNYLDNIIGRQEAEAQGADEALLRNTVGNLAEATASNLFLVIEDRLLTPPVSDGALSGVVREEILEDAEEKTIEPQDISKASEAFLTNSLGVRPLISVDGQLVGSGEVGHFTKKFLNK
jgi:branched-chain amino acid aminotransferase